MMTEAVHSTKPDSKNTEILAQLAVAQALELKGINPICLDLRHLNVISDYFVIVSATNNRQSAAIAETIRIFFKQNLGLHTLGVDGFETGNWILLDYGALFVHVFVESTREFYQLEELWSKGRPVELASDPVALLASYTAPK